MIARCKLAGTVLPHAFEQAGLKVQISDILARLVFWLILLAFSRDEGQVTVPNCLLIEQIVVGDNQKL